jgi:tetratricopeptide (TPR) repeat protein
MTASRSRTKTSPSSTSPRAWKLVRPTVLFLARLCIIITFFFLTSFRFSELVPSWTRSHGRPEVQAVYRDSWNPTFWCSIGVLYFQINQYRDALDAYSRAIRINPYILEVWFNLGSLYESCNNQISVPKELRINCHSSTIDGPSLQKCIALQKFDLVASILARVP